MSAQLNDFLYQILPDTGKYIYAWKEARQGGMSQRVADTLDQLVASVTSLSERGFDTYFACSAFTGTPIYETVDGKQVARYRLKEQAVGTKAFWIDIDVAKEKKDAYDTLEEAEQDLFAWLDEWGMPDPTIVYSGGGLHVYWALDRVLAREEWEPLAYRLKTFCERSELKIDRTRTGDIASILRPPTTRNYKRWPDSQPVALYETAPAIAPETLAAKLPQIAMPARTVRRPSMVVDQFTDIGQQDIPAFSVKVAEGCQWVRAIGPHARGNVAEPLWYAMLGVLAFAADGDGMAHEWSNGHPGYSEEETDRKLAQVRSKQTGPISCTKLEYEWREGCQGCPVKGTITTPLQLGRPKAEKHDPRAALAEIINPVASAPVAGAIDEDAHGVVVDWPYCWASDGGLFQTITNEDNPFADTLYAYPWYIESMRKAELSGTAHTLVRHWAPHDGWQEANIPAGDLTADGAFRMLGNQHIEVDPLHYKPFLLFMSRSKQTYRDNRRTEIQHETFGWKEHGFLIGETLVVGKITARAGLSPELARFAGKFRAKGALTAWQGAAQELFKPGYEHQAMALLASLGAPLMRFAPYPGAIYSIISEHSGRGKTFAVEAATSIWGDEKCNWITHRDDKAAAGDTVKAQYRAMGLLSNLPIVADELRDVEPERLRGFATGFTDGSPPRGLTRDGVFRQSLFSWQTNLTITSNKSIVDTLTVNNDPAAANRVFEVTATLPKDADSKHATALRETMLQNCGNAGIVYIQKLMEEETFAWAQAEVRSLVDSLTMTLQAQRSNKDGGDRYIASFLATCIVAGKIATQMGLLKVDTDHLLTWALSRWGRQSTQIEQTHRTSPEAISAFVREHIMNIVSTGVNETTLDGSFRGPLVGRIEHDTGKLFIDRSALQRWTTKENLHYLGICEELSQMGVLLDRNARRNLGKGTKIGNTGQTAVWIIDSLHPAISCELREVSGTPTPKPSSSDPIPMRQPVPTAKATAKEGGTNG